MVRLERAARFGHFYNGVSKHGRLHFRCSPAEFDFDVDTLGGEVALGDFNKFGGYDLSFKVFGFFKPAALGNGKHPAHLAAALLCVSERSDACDVEAAFNYPVNSGQAGVEHTMIDVACHLLRANQHALDLAVVD